MSTKILSVFNSEYPLLMKRLWSQCKYSSNIPEEFEKISVSFTKGDVPVRVWNGGLVIKEQITEEQLKKELIKYLDLDSTLSKLTNEDKTKIFYPAKATIAPQRKSQSVQTTDFSTLRHYEEPLPKAPIKTDSIITRPSVAKKTKKTTMNSKNQTSKPTNSSESGSDSVKLPGQMESMLLTKPDILDRNQEKTTFTNTQRHTGITLENVHEHVRVAATLNETKTSILDKFKEVEILKSKDGTIDFKGLLDNDAEFLAFDFELTGIGALRGPNGPPSIAERVNAVKTNSIVQVGLMFMRQVKRSNSDLIQMEQVGPVYKISVSKVQNASEVEWQEESLVYLQQHGFSLENWCKKAIPQSQLKLVWEMM